MSQGNPENFPVEKHNFVQTLNASDLVAMSNFSDYNTVEVSTADINNLHLILNNNHCGKAFFKKICDALNDAGVEFQVSNKNDNLMQENVTIITLDQQMIAGEGVALIGPYRDGTANNSEALLKAMQVTFQKSGWSTDTFSGISQYQALTNGEIGYVSAPSSTEKSTFPANAQITISFGTMRDDFTTDRIAGDLILSLARYEHFMKNDRENIMTVSNPSLSKVSYDNHYSFNEQINLAPSFRPDMDIKVERAMAMTR